ncbi:phage neck terminator protein [Paenibacillus spongiae]|uniref:Phage neck terminator protein gp12-like domain-containing protein n=1 Tax=Paenibacillus spongiae TaxID=2909671 RepID=A0ABY5S6J3_9BACL|nr:hypothetical protein [Paenibacillus spongiae]UVI28170.1 hypothetical protein L1F29_22290 [Paenibacillus spongiae]
MIQFELIREVMIEGLSEHLGVPVIEIDGKGEVPPYPFMTYSFTDEGSIVGHMASKVVGDRIIYFGTVPLSVSFQSYALSRLESVNQANRARDWFLTDGHWLLKDAAGVVVVEVGQTQNNDLQIGDEWERRNGFEIDCRTTNIIDQELQSIDEVNLKGVDPING